MASPPFRCPDGFLACVAPSPSHAAYSIEEPHACNEYHDRSAAMSWLADRTDTLCFFSSCGPADGLAR